MPKTRETWTYRELVSSSKLNQSITDYITRGQLIHSSVATISASVAGVNNPANTIYVGTFPYNADKQIFDAMLVQGYYRWNWMGAAPTYVLEHTINTCSSWAATGLGGAMPCPGLTSAPFIDGLGVAGSNFASGTAIVPLGLVAGGNLFAWRLNNTTPANLADTIGWWLNVYLYSTTDTPY